MSEAKYKMGAELAEQFDALSNELVSLHLRWNQYRTLYGDEPRAIDDLNQTASSLFRIVQDVLFENTMLAIARIVDRPEMRDKSNLSIRRFETLVRDELKPAMSEHVQIALNAARFTRDWRDRHIAHRDLGLALQRIDIKPLAEATRAKVENALTALDNVLNFVAAKYNGAYTHYPTVIVLGDANDLLYFIRSGLKHEGECGVRWDPPETQSTKAELEQTAIPEMDFRYEWL